MSAELTYDGAGLTEPASASWTVTVQGFRRFEQTVLLGHGDNVWRVAASQVMEWGIKRRSGFRVRPPGVVSEGGYYVITAGYGPFVVREPVWVVAVVDEPDRRGFAYGTAQGHPVCGEEAFIVHRDAAGQVFLTLRSVTSRAPSGLWRPLFPVLLLAQRFFRRRYLRALTP